MSYLFDLNPTEQRGAFQTAVTNSTDIVNAPFFEGAGTGLMSGLKSSYYRQIYESAGSDPENAQSRQNAIDQLEKLKPDPRSVGTAGNILYSLADTLGTVYAEFAQMPLMPTASLKSITTSSPSLLAIESGKTYSRSQEQLYIRQGIDPVTAQSLAATDAASVGLGVLVPAAVPGKFATRALSGGAIMMGFGATTRAAMSYELENAGYVDLARQYKVFDVAHVLTDFALGAFFGGALGPRPAARDANVRVLPSDVDAALTMGNAAHIETGTIPGMPTDSVARQAHVNAVNKALDDLMNGRPVDVGDQVTRAPFEPKAESVLRQEVTLEVEQHLAEQLQSLKAELQRRGLSTEDIDQTAPVTLREVGTPGSAAIKEVIPNAAVGERTSVKIEGKYQDATWAIVDAKDVEATMAKGPNQFRDRFRAASQTQIEKIANAPDFNLLEASPLMDFGAPTLTNDGLIVGGNGRFAGVAKSYGKGTGEIYRTALRASLAKFGLKEADLAGKERPILVRVLDNPVDVQRVAMASNEGAGLRLSPPEQAKIDSIRLGDITGMSMGDNGEVNLAANISYIQRWAAQFPETEQAGLVDKAGRLSPEGEKRLRNAMLFRVLGDGATLERMLDSTDPGARNVATALVRTAPMIAEMKAAMERGDLYPLDISEDITAAVEKLEAIRSNGGKVKDYLEQTEMFGAELTPIARMMLEQFDKNMRSAKAMTEIIKGYYDAVEALGNPRQGNMLGEAPPTREQILASIVGKDQLAQALPDWVTKIADIPPDSKVFYRLGWANEIGSDVTGKYFGDANRVARHINYTEENYRDAGDTIFAYAIPNKAAIKWEQNPFQGPAANLPKEAVLIRQAPYRAAKSSELLKSSEDGSMYFYNRSGAEYMNVKGADVENYLGFGAANKVSEAQKAQQLPLKNADQARVNELLSTEGVFDEAQLARLPEAEQGVLRNLYQRAAQLKDAFDQLGQEIAQQVGGRLLIPNIKGTERAVAKITSDLAGNAGGIKDLLRATIEVDSVAQARAAIDLLQQRFQVLESGYRDLFDPAVNPKDGYRDAKMNIQLDGIVAEMQVNLPAMLEAKKQVHSKYVERSAIERAIVGRDATDAELARIERLNAEMKDVYDAAFASATKDANLASETGAPFLRADSELNGRGGSVSQAAQYNLTPGTLPRETGMPSTSKSSTEGGNFTDITSVDNVPEMLKNVNPEAAVAAQVLTERPNLTIPDENGQPMLASDALAQADAEIAAAMREAPGFDAAVSCALRNS